MNDVWDFYYEHKKEIDTWARDESYPILAAYARTIQNEVARIEKANAQRITNLGEEESKWLVESGADLNQIIRSQMNQAQEEG